MKKVLFLTLLIAVLLAVSVCLCSCEELLGKKTSIIFDDGLDDVQNSVLEVKDFDEVTVPADPAREGYLFGGWYFDSEYKEPFTLSALFDKEKGGTITVYAKWTAHSELLFKYELHLDGAAYKILTVKGLSIADILVPEKDGYAFGGWYSDPEFKSSFTDENISVALYGKTVALYAKMIPYSECEYKLKFTVDGESYVTIVTDVLSYVLPNAPTKAGDFIGWYLEGGAPLSSEALKGFRPGDTVTVSARWQQTTAATGYKVELYVDGALWQTKYTVGGKLTPPTPAAKEHCTFDGWFYDQAFKYAFGEDDRIEANKKLYAKYSPMQIIVTMHMPDGALSSRKISYGESFSLTKINVDYTNKRVFLGWRLAGTDTLLTDENGKSLAPSAFETDIDVEAVIREYSCQLTYYPMGERKTGYTVYAFDGELEEPIPDPVPSEAGMIFDGWYIKRDGEKIDIDLDTYDFTDDSLSVYARIITEKIIISENGYLNESLKITMTEQVHYYTNSPVMNLAYHLRDIQAGLQHYPAYESESAASAVEIIVGADSKHRGERYSVASSELEELGYVIKAVDDKIIIAGATDKLTKEAFDRFVSEVMGIEIGTLAPIGNISVDRDLYLTKTFPVKSASIAGKALSSFIIVGDESLQREYSILYDLSDAIYDRYPALLDVNYSGTENASESRIIISLGDIPEDTNGDGFVVTVSGGNLYIKCAYANAIYDNVLDFVNNDLLKSGVNTLAEGYKYTKRVSVVTYEQFGAVGNGVTDDFLAIKAAHEYANAGGQRVEGRAGANYFIGACFTESIPIKTDVDFRGATIFIDDSDIEAYKNRELPLFLIEGERTALSVPILKNTYGTLSISRGDTSIPWLAGELDGEKLVVVRSSEPEWRTFDSGELSYRTESFIVDENGNIIGGEALFDLPGITDVLVIGGCNGITVENGVFKTVAPTVNSMTDGENRNHPFYRGIMICNAGGVTLKNITHSVLNEPILGTKYGYQRESYPYGGFIVALSCYDLTLDNLQLYAHMQYYIYDPLDYGSVGYVAMPSYDIALSGCVGVDIRGLKQQSEQSLTDSMYARIMYASRVKDLSVSDSEINSVMLKNSMGASFTNTKIGTGINLCGFGDHIFEGVTRLVGNVFITLPYESGASLDGDLILKDCTLSAGKIYNSITAEQESGNYTSAYLINSTYRATDPDYLDWYFGFDTTLPVHITVENLITPAETAYVFSDLSNTAFDGENENCYGVTEKITFVNMEAIATVKNSAACTVLAAIPVEVK